jgi:hypothetical protein
MKLRALLLPLFVLAFARIVFAEGNVKVFLLAGDESMLRHGAMFALPGGARMIPMPLEKAEATPGMLPHVLKQNPRYAFLRNAEGAIARKLLSRWRPLKEPVTEPEAGEKKLVLWDRPLCGTEVTIQFQAARGGVAED